MVSGTEPGRARAPGTPEGPVDPPTLAEFMASIVESFPAGVLAETVDRRVLALNARFCALMVQPSSPVVLLGSDSRTLWQALAPPADAEWLAESIDRRVHDGAAVRGELVRLSDGRVLERDFVPVFGRDGSPLGHLWLCSDVTTERRAEEYQLTTRKMEAVGRLAGGVAHDLNNALTAILGHASLLGCELGDRPELAESVAEIQTASERAATLARNLLAFSRKQVLLPGRTDPAEVVRRVAELLGRMLGEGVVLAVSLPDERGWVHVDAIKLEHALLHLAMNARDAMPGGGRLTLALGYRDVSEEDAQDYPFPIVAGRYAVLSVADTGAGISEDIRSKVFDPFFSTKPRHQGTGLGLSTVYGFVKQSDGFVWVESREGPGAAIHVALPLLSAWESPEGESDSAASVRRGDRPATVLVAEDETAVLRVIRRGLEDKGYRVVSAADGVEALVILERGPEPIDVLVTDVIMPRMGGVELAHRAHALNPGLPVIFTSGYSGDVLKYLRDAPKRFRLIEKPFMPEDVVRVVEETLSE